jgi:hypothetical protein
MAGFVNQLSAINTLADSSPGFIWRLQSETGITITRTSEPVRLREDAQHGHREKQTLICRDKHSHSKTTSAEAYKGGGPSLSQSPHAQCLGNVETGPSHSQATETLY